MKHFKISEFDSPDITGSGNHMNVETLSMVDNAREYAGIPFVVNSGARTDSHNSYVGGKDDSSHLISRGCYAVDFECLNSVNRFKMINGLIKAGFKRIGIAKTFIHADNDPSKPSCIWLY